ncbi:MAG: hypothetical protein L0Y32_05305 [Nevskiales bacterium]|nr:hypothetical protein [Nevskiales bacterium]
MQKGLLIIALGLSIAVGLAANVLTPSESKLGPGLKLPQRGTLMGDVEKQYGEPRTRYPAVGGETPEHPPITRWDYEDFIVFFEHDRVVDSVVPGAPRPAPAPVALPELVAPPAEEPAITPAEPEPVPEVEASPPPKRFPSPPRAIKMPPLALPR